MKPIDIITYWLGSPDSPSYPEARMKLWFGHAPEVDAEMRERFMSIYEKAAAGELTEWETDPKGRLALILILDQFSRNLFRDQARMYAADERAAQLALATIGDGWHLQHYAPLERLFIYLPLEHTESLPLQKFCVRLFQQMESAAGEDSPDIDLLRNLTQYAHKHHDVVAEFGRFPHRNAILGRTNTAEEEKYLATPGAGF
jgi:uncharacterized protein (DUF924 family)